MKWINYKYLSNESAEIMDAVPTFFEKSVAWSEKNEEIAKKEAYNGEYTIEDDTQEEFAEPTTEERLDALEAAMLEMALGGVGNG